MERCCDICGKLLKKDQSKTCSYECRNKYISKIRKEEGQERICLVCDTIFTVKKKSSKKECCSRSCAVTLGHQRQESLFQSRMEETKTCIVYIGIDMIQIRDGQGGIFVAKSVLWYMFIMIH